MHFANNIDDEDIKLIPEIFKNMDGDQDGLVNSNELKEFI
jgi:Ca2+-binding EF-hand superfamily protein